MTDERDPFNNSDSTPEMDAEAILDIQLDESVVQQTRKDALSPSGSYRTTPPLSATVKAHDETGRPMARFYGLATNNRDEQVTGRFGFAISPVRANKLNWETSEDTGKPDNQSILFEQAYGIYERTYGEKPQTFAQLVEFLRDYSVNLRVIQVGVPTKNNPEPNGDPGNVVMGLSMVRDS